MLWPVAGSHACSVDRAPGPRGGYFHFVSGQCHGRPPSSTTAVLVCQLGTTVLSAATSAPQRGTTPEKRSLQEELLPPARLQGARRPAGGSAAPSLAALHRAQGGASASVWPETTVFVQNQQPCLYRSPGPEHRAGTNDGMLMALVLSGSGQLCTESPSLGLVLPEPKPPEVSRVHRARPGHCHSQSRNQCLTHHPGKALPI